jgi:hypothetical protein
MEYCVFGDVVSYCDLVLTSLSRCHIIGAHASTHPFGLDRVPAHHVIVRGIERKDLFVHETGRQRFVDKLGDYVSATGCSLCAWTQMSNHVHLLMKSGNRGIPGIMRRFLTWYAVELGTRRILPLLPVF